MVRVHTSLGYVVCVFLMKFAVFRSIVKLGVSSAAVIGLCLIVFINSLF